MNRRPADPPGLARPARSSRRRLEPLVEAIGHPIGSTPWSPDFTIQAVEILPVGLRQGSLCWLKPVHAPSLVVALRSGVLPADQVLEVITWYPLSPLVVHSTSWRLDGGRVVLTYVVAVDLPDRLPPASLVEVPVARADLARGESKSAPKDIAIGAVLEHGLRHLAWLLRDDVAVRAALPGWTDVLSVYEPEPFRALS